MSRGPARQTVLSEHPCGNCGGPVIGLRRGRRYCSARCRQAAYRSRRAADYAELRRLAATPGPAWAAAAVAVAVRDVRSKRRKSRE